jgi:hypothetical protein
MRTRHRLVKALLALAAQGCALSGSSLPKGTALSRQERVEVIRSAAVWSPTNIPTMDFKTGPKGEGAFAPNQWVACDYKQKKMKGHSPKFTCEISPGREIKVKYGSRNAEIFGEVMATRLFWGLGFAADRMYPVRVRCRGCSDDPKQRPEKVRGTQDFPLAAVERKLPGRAMETKPDSGWTFPELDDLGPEAPPDGRAQRDALKLLVAFVQHGDSKAANQRILCPAGEEVGKKGCRAPVLMVQDLGITFGASTLLNKNLNAASFIDWAEVPVWADPERCVARLRGSLTGTAKNPVISEAGRSFLAGLMAQITDAQLRDLFEVSRIKRRSADPATDAAEEPPPATVNEWVRLFKLKRAQIVDHRCPEWSGKAF